MKYLCKIRYTGTDFCGYQIQPACRTVQGVFEEAARAVFGAPVRTTGCSRTDSGVHAEAFYLTVTVVGGNRIPAERLPLAFATFLPPDLALLRATVVRDEFHARHDVKEKTYVYRIHASRTNDPFLVHRAFWVKQPLDIAAMREAARHFVGEHDFRAFMAEGSPVLSTVRRVFSAEVTGTGSEILFRVTGNGFLYNMVRIMAGTLIDVGAGRKRADEIPAILRSCDRVRAGQTAPPDGLYLSSVDYGEDLGF